MNKLAHLEGYMEKKALSLKTLTEAGPGIFARNAAKMDKAHMLEKITNNPAYEKVFSNYAKRNSRLADSLYLKYPEVDKLVKGNNLNDVSALQAQLASTRDVLHGYGDNMPAHLKAIKDNYSKLTTV